MKESVYLMPGMGANPRIFEFLSLTKDFEIHHLSWFSPEKEESLDHYAKRMSQRIKHKNPILVGVSFGGILVQEIAQHLQCKKVIIISSVKTNHELPNHMKLAQVTHAHRLLPTKWFKNIEFLASFVFGKGIKRRLVHYDRYLSERDPEYLNWAIDQLVNWNRSEALKDIVHIHGAKDSIFPIKKIHKPFKKIEGDHAIILTRSEWFNKNLPKIIAGNVVD
ncbi:alpha/beta hydrolase [Flavobacteriaceae bacterium]|jgi:pimeloyl-ACP methyl ester carboxylesterase|nr:alpha/beta hydrolase [Flavobacteriaceae bacterium]